MVAHLSSAVSVVLFMFWRWRGETRFQALARLPLSNSPTLGILCCVKSYIIPHPQKRKYRGCEWGQPTSDNGRKMLLTTDKTGKKLPTTDRKNINRLQIWAGDIIFFHKEEHIYLSIGSNQLYQRLYKFYWKDKGEKPNISCFNERHKSFDKYTTKRGYWNGLQSEWKFLQSNPPIPTHYLREMLTLILKWNSFRFNGKVFLQTNGTAHDGHKLRQQQFPLPTGMY